MGSSQSSDNEQEDSQNLSQDQLELIRSRTHFSGQELQEWHDKFITDFPSGRIDKDAFISYYCQMLPDGDSHSFAEHVFRAYDRDGNGTIDFREFMVTMSATTRGTAEEKLKWAFHLYDVNKDGILSRKEITDILVSIYKMRGVKRGLRTKAEDAALAVFVAIDRDRDDLVSQEEFIRGIQQCASLKHIIDGGSEPEDED